MTAAPKIISGADQSYQKGGAGASFISDAPFSLYLATYIDGEKAPADAITVEPGPDGSTKVTIHDDVLAKLQNSVHKLEIDSKNGAAQTTFTLTAASGSTDGGDTAADAASTASAAATASPKTGTVGSPALWLALMLVSAAGALGTAIYIVRLRHMG